MSVKSTEEITREDAIERIISSPKIKDVLKALFEFTSNKRLEDILESLAEVNGDHYTNYLIVEKREN
jgi:hypothetical protein